MAFDQDLQRAPGSAVPDLPSDGDVPDERWEPEHTAVATERQITNGAMDGFAASYAETLGSRRVNDGDPKRRGGLLQRRRPRCRSVTKRATTSMR